MKRFSTFLLLACLCASAALQAADLTAGREYYIVLGIYDKALGSSSDGNSPALSAIGTNEDANSYIFVAEESGQNGYVLLKQKSTGRYLASSTSNSYSVVFQASKGTSDAYCWKASEGPQQKLVNKRNTSKQLGIDGGQSGKSYVSVYYDKNRGSHAEFDIIPVAGTEITDARRAFEGDVYTNAIGRQEVDYFQIYDKRVEFSDPVDIHITAKEAPIRGSAARVTLGSLDTWLIFDNIKPQDIINSSDIYRVYIGTSQAKVGSNCRVDIYLNGSVIIPTRVSGNSLHALTLYSGQNCEGNSTWVGADITKTTLDRYNNVARSFVLKRGHMATLATGTNGSGYSRVYVADHADLVINELPTALDRRITSVFVKSWPYLSKKGWGDTGGATRGSDLGATWFWSWSAGYNSTSNMEYVPCRQHKYWPSASEVNNKTSTAAFSINEPEHSEQHNSCACGGTVDAWYCTTITPNFQAGGGRIGSPQPTDFSWLYDYFTKTDNMAYRCDFAVTHAYWQVSGRSAADYASWFASECKKVWDNTGRPLWLTEMEMSASWHSEQSSFSEEKFRALLQAVLEKLDECDYVERYAIYNTDGNEKSHMFYNKGGFTPSGQVYRDHHATFAYNSKYTKVPNWWAPSAKKPSFTMEQNATTGKLSFRINNPNGDLTERLVVERQAGGEGDWVILSEMTDRYRFDNTTLSINNVDATGMDLETDRFRVTVTTLLGKTVSSSSADLGYLTNPIIETDSKEEVSGWTCTRDAANGYTKASSGDTYFEVWDANASKINFDYYQTVTDLPTGIYSLSANVFNTVNKVDGATINGAVGLYAQTSLNFYFAPVTTDTPIADDATELTDVPLSTLDRIVVTDGYLRVGIRNMGAMTGRWAGGDNFILKRVGSLTGVDVNAERAVADIHMYQLMPALGDDVTSDISVPRDASAYIVNADANRSDSYGWEATNVSFKTDAESYDGNSSNTYWNQWKSGAFSSSLTQEVTGLPAGKYTFSAILRGQSTATMTLSATANAITVSQSFTGTGITSPAGSPYANGWQVVTTEPINVENGQTLLLTFSADASATAWWSADHFALTLVEIPSSRTAVEAPLIRPAATDNTLFDLMGRKMSNSTLGNRSLPKGIYIINGKKVLVR